MWFTGDIETGMGECPKCKKMVHYTDWPKHSMNHFRENMGLANTSEEM